MKYLVAIIQSILSFAVYILLIGFPLMWLWNAILPELFGFKFIDFWQALGLSAISRILFNSNKLTSN